MKREEMTEEEAETYKSMLWRQTTVEALEARRVVRKQDPAWVELKNRLTEQDELWQYSSSKQYWIHSVGYAGIAIVRDGEILEIMSTLHN